MSSVSSEGIIQGKSKYQIKKLFFVFLRVVLAILSLTLYVLALRPNCKEKTFIRFAKEIYNPDK